MIKIWNDNGIAKVLDENAVQQVVEKGEVAKFLVLKNGCLVKLAECKPAPEVTQDDINSVIVRLNDLEKSLNDLTEEVSSLQADKVVGFHDSTWTSKLHEIRKDLTQAGGNK